MNSVRFPDQLVGNDFRLAQPKLQTAAEPAMSVSIIPTAISRQETITVSIAPKKRLSHSRQLLDLFYAHSLVSFALLFLLVVGSATIVAGRYASAHVGRPAAAITLPLHHALSQPKTGYNSRVAAQDLPQTLKKITGQPLSLNLGSQSVNFSSTTISGWISSVVDKSKHVAYIHVDEAAVKSSVDKLVASNTRAPRNQVVATYADGTSAVIVSGSNGSQPADPAGLAKNISQHLLAGGGMQLNLPVQSLPFQSVTPAAFDKLLEINVITKQMYAYDKGVVTRSFAISAGAPATPTPIGQFRIYEKLPVQDMRGFNANGTRYLQPHVRWINYFLPGGYAVHGNYWRPQSWFGAINSSHGCVSLPEDQAKWVYDWAPIGTTVITHR